MVLRREFAFFGSATGDFFSVTHRAQRRSLKARSLTRESTGFARGTMKFIGGLNIAAAVSNILLVSSTQAASVDQLPSNGCGHAPDARSNPGRPSGTFKMTNAVTGVARQGLLHLPESYSGDEPAPLILAFHGKGQSTSEMESQTQLSNVEFNRDAIVVYPQGIKVSKLQSYLELLLLMPKLTRNRSNGPVTPNLLF